jgi:hypothetical protein
LVKKANELVLISDSKNGVEVIVSRDFRFYFLAFLARNNISSAICLAGVKKQGCFEENFRNIGQAIAPGNDPIQPPG